MKNKTSNPENAAMPATGGYVLDAEIGVAMGDFLALHPPEDLPQRGDWEGLKENSDRFYGNLGAELPTHPEVVSEDFPMATASNTVLKLRWYTLKGSKPPGSAVVYLHGGGKVSGSVNLYDPMVAGFVFQSGVPFLSVDYTLSPKARGTTQAEEAFSAFMWLSDHAEIMGIDRARIAVMGDSAGGGIAAAVAILARDRNIHLAQQILIYPMLDDRTMKPDEKLLPFAAWNYDNNYTGWKALLGTDPGGDNVSEIIAPGRLANFDGLAPTYISVGQLDIFLQENIAYAQQLVKAGVPAEFHIHSGAIHGFEFIAPNSAIAKRAMADHVRVIRSV